MVLKKKHPKTYPFAGRNKNFLTFLETFEIAASMIKIAQDNEKINSKDGKFLISTQNPVLDIEGTESFLTAKLLK